MKRNDKLAAGLPKLTKVAKSETKRHKEIEMTALTPEMETVAASRGFDLQELLAAAETLRKRGPKVPPKYRNPDNPEEQWAGRGKKPLWFIRALSEGKTEQEMLIPKA